MRITILTVGSLGDVRPYTALGLGLKKAGHQVRLATHSPFQEFVVSHGLDFVPIEGNPQELLRGQTGQAWLESGRNPVRFIRAFLDMFRPFVKQFFADAQEVCQDADAIVYSLFGFAGFHIAEALGIPSCAAILQPLTRTRAFPLIQLPQRFNLGGTFNLLTHLAGEQLFVQPLISVVNEWRQESLNLPAAPRLNYYGWLYYEKREPFLYGFSPSVIPKPADWPAWHYVTGYWFLDQPADWQPPAELVDFIGGGPPPVYVGFGSMVDKEPEALTQLILDALAQAGQRGVLLSGWSDLGSLDLPDDVLAVDSVPHDWLFPQMAAVVHHGGAGTTAAGLRAGVPSVVAPYFADQPFWGERVAALGVGPPPIPQKKLTAERLAAGIRTAVGDDAMRARAAALGQRIRSEDGVASAVEIVHRALR